MVVCCKGRFLCVLSSYVQLFGHRFRVDTELGLIKAALVTNESSLGTEGQGK